MPKAGVRITPRYAEFPDSAGDGTPALQFQISLLVANIREVLDYSICSAGDGTPALQFQISLRVAYIREVLDYSICSAGDGTPALQKPTPGVERSAWLGEAAMSLSPKGAGMAASKMSSQRPFGLSH